MAIRFINDKTERFYFLDDEGHRKSYNLIFGDEVNTLTTPAPSGASWQSVSYRGRTGEIKNPRLSSKRALEMYFLDVGQGDAAFVVTPNDSKILIDGGLKNRALGFLIWKYRLDRPNTRVTLDYLILSHADADHVQGLIPILNHPRIEVKNILHNGIGIYKSGLDTPLGNISDDRLTTLHSTTADLDGATLHDDFKKWIDAVKDSGAEYHAVDTRTGILNIGDPDIKVEILGPRRDSNGTSLKWLGDKSHTINGHSLVFRMTYDYVRTFFSGDLNTKGSKNLLTAPNAALGFNAHIFKAPHHGSHDFHPPMFEAINPMITVVSSGDNPDHGHPRANFLGAIGQAARGDEPLLFSTEIAATFVDVGEQATNDDATPTNELDFSTSAANTAVRRQFKKALSGIINLRSDGKKIYAARRVMTGYQWESYGPITPIN